MRPPMRCQLGRPRRSDGTKCNAPSRLYNLTRGIARAFHDAGASVVPGDVREDALDQAQGTFSNQERLAFVPVDVRDAAAVANLVATAEQVFGPPAVMIANAGIVPNASLLNMDVSAWDAVIETNLQGGRRDVHKGACNATGRTSDQRQFCRAGSD